MADYLNFGQLKTRVRNIIRDFNNSMNDIIESTINMVYLNEIMVYDRLHPLWWMMDMDDSLEAQAPAQITGITKANPGIFTTEENHNLSVYDLVVVNNIRGMTELNDRVFSVSAVPGSKLLNLGVSTAQYTDYIEGGTIGHRGKVLNTIRKPVQRITNASWHDEKPMVAMGPGGFDKNFGENHWTDNTGIPVRYYFGKTYSSTGQETNQIIWHPSSDDNYKLRYWFESRAERLVNDSDVPKLPPQFHHMIVAGVAVRLAENNVMVNNPKVWPGLYKTQLEAMKTLNSDFWENADSEDMGAPFLL